MRIVSVSIKIKNMKKIVVAIGILTLSSCGIMGTLTDEQVMERSKIKYQINKAYNEYQLLSDSLHIEYCKIK